MGLFILTETSAGYALLKARDKHLLEEDNIDEKTRTAQETCSLLKLKQFQKFENAASALEEAAAVSEGKVTSMLSSLLDSLKDEKKGSLAVADPKLGNAINKLPGFKLKVVAASDSSVMDVYRAIRSHLPSLIPGLMPDGIDTMSLGLSHSLSRHKLRFSPDKVDTMIIQAIALLDDLDKELNIYAMRVKEWYGWHFPEVAKIINDNLAYARVILKMGMRSNAAKTDLDDILPEEIAEAVKKAAEISMGTEITKDDLENIRSLAEQVVSFTEYRTQLSEYLSARMHAIAPNLAALVGELVGARLIAHAGSLMNLAKSPASTIQILGAEKALFRALKTKHDTPKYGLIYHASLIGQASGKNKGKIARLLATKAALGLRVDALTEWPEDEDEPTEEQKSEVGVAARARLEKRLRMLEGRPLRTSGGVAIGPAGQLQQEQPSKWEIKEAKKYNPDADALEGDEPAPNEPAPSKKSHALNGGAKVQEIKGVGMEDEDGSDSDEAESDEDVPMTNGASAGKSSKSKSSSKEAKRAEKEAKRKKREAKAAAKGMDYEEYKRLKKAGKAEKKRKREKGEEDVERKKKKKHSSH